MLNNHFCTTLVLSQLEQPVVKYSVLQGFEAALLALILGVQYFCYEISSWPS